MALVAAGATRDQKQAWLLRPFDWASNVAIYGVLMVAVSLLDKGHGKVICGYAAFATLPVILGLLLWGFRRMYIATGGQG